MEYTEIREALNHTEEKIKELQEQYQKGELSSMDTLEAIRDLLTNFN